MKITTDIDDDLREIPRDRNRLAEAIDKSHRELEFLRRQVQDEASTLNTTRVGRQLQRHGRYLRLAGRTEEALAAKTEAIAIWEEYGRKRAHFLCRLQRATIRQEAGQCDRALAELRQLGDEIDDDTAVYRDVLDEALGICHYRRGEPDTALEHLRTALQIRQDRGSRHHIEWTRRIIAIVEG